MYTKLILIVCTLLISSTSFLVESVEAEQKLSSVMEICDEGKGGQLTQDQVEFVYDSILSQLKGADAQELIDTVSESKDLFTANMAESTNKESKVKHLDNHTLRLCVMYSMIKSVLNGANEI